MHRRHLILMAVILVGGSGLLIAAQALISRTGPARAIDVAAVLNGTVRGGAVTLTGIVDEVDPVAGQIYLRDLKEKEVCIDDVCMLPLIRVVTDGNYEAGKRATIRGTIANDGGQPYLVAQKP
jgi:hypothetical protein